MKKLFAISLLMLFITAAATAQSTLKSCKITVAHETFEEATVEQAIRWADSKPICVKCEDGVIYEINKMNFRMILQDPFRNKDFGTTEKGLPLLGRKLMSQSKEGDTVFLRSATYIDAEGKEQDLPNIVFRIVSGGEPVEQVEPILEQSQREN